MALGQKEIRLSIKANTAKFEEQLKKLPGVTDKEAKKMARQFARQFDKAEQAAKKSSRQMANSYKGSFGKMGKAAKDFQKVLAAGVFASAAAGVFKLANSASEYVDKVGLMSRQTGLTSETLIGLEFAAEAAGGNIDELKEGLNALTQKAGMASRKGGEAAAIFKDIGVSVNDANGNLRSADEIFRDTINALSGLSSTSDKASVALELFGGGGAKVAAILADGTGSLDEWTAKAREAGLVMDGEALKASEDMDRGMAQLKLTMRAVTLETGKNLIPAMILVTEAVGKVINVVAKAVVAWDDFTDSLFGDIKRGQAVQNTYVGIERAIHQTRKAAEQYEGTLTNLGGVTMEGAEAAQLLQRRVNLMENATIALMEGNRLTEREQRNLNKAIEEGRHIARQMGLDFNELTKELITAREAELELESGDFSDLESEISRLGQSTIITDKLAASADQAADKLAALNRSFELEALARVDEPLAKFQQEIDRVNTALLQGLDAQLGHDAILAAVDELNETRLEKEQEVQDKITEMNQKRIEARLAAEEAANEQAAAIQTAFAEGTISLANDVFELAKSQRGISFEQQQALAIAQAVMNTAVAITKTFAEQGVTPLSIANAAIAATAGGIQIAQIKSQTMHAGGMVGGTPDEVPANLLRGEAVITRAGVDALGGEQAVNAINRGGSSMPMIIVNKYKHRTLDIQIRDQLRTDSALTRATANAGRAGHR